MRAAGMSSCRKKRAEKKSAAVCDTLYRELYIRYAGLLRYPAEGFLRCMKSGEPMADMQNRISCHCSALRFVRWMASDIAGIERMTSVITASAPM